jgi:hypothetical protein
MWAQTDNDVHSTGTTCAAGRAIVSLDSVNLPPRVTMETYSIPDVLCPRSEIRFDLPLFDPHWGRD